MLLAALLLPLASAHLHYLPTTTTDLINGHFRTKFLPYDGPATGMTQYFAVWGINATIAESIKENPWTSIWKVKEDQSGVTLSWIDMVDDVPFVMDLTWGQPLTFTHPTLGIDMTATVDISGPNTLSAVYVVKDQGITDEDECHTKYNQECHDEFKDECHTEYNQECYQVPEEICTKDECHTVYNKECKNVPEEICTKVAHQKCKQVPEEICTKVPHQGITDVNTLRFTAAGILKYAVAKKAVHPFWTGWNSFQERVDDEGNPAPLPARPLAFYYY